MTPLIWLLAHPKTLIAIITLCYAGYYAAKCWMLPYDVCRKCDGRGRMHRQLWSRPCWWCDTDGIRLRWGRRAYNALVKRHRAAPAADVLQAHMDRIAGRLNK